MDDSVTEKVNLSPPPKKKKKKKNEHFLSFSMNKLFAYMLVQASYSSPWKSSGINPFQIVDQV